RMRRLLHLQEGRVGDDVSAGEDLAGRDHDAGARRCRRVTRLPGRVVVRLLRGGEDSDDLGIPHGNDPGYYAPGALARTDGAGSAAPCGVTGWARISAGPLRPVA